VFDGSIEGEVGETERGEDRWKSLDAWRDWWMIESYFACRSESFGLEAKAEAREAISVSRSAAGTLFS
jgi:hypothetical protein